MGKEEDSLLKFLSMEKSQDVESCCNEKPKQVKMQSSVGLKRRGEEEGVVSPYPVFWICVAASLLVLSLVSGAFQFCPLPYRLWHWHAGSVLVPRKVVNSVPVYEVSLRDIGDEALEGFFAESRFSDQFTVRDEYQGEAIVHDGRAYLTSKHSADERGVVAKPHSVGRLLHSQVLQMKHRGPKPGEETAASFRVTFVFSIENSLGGREATGDGFAFVMVPEGNVMGSAGGNLGVVESDKGEAHHTFAVEFDTWKNPSLQDSSNNHVGINVNSMVSLVAEEAGYWTSHGNELRGRGHEFRPLDLTSGKIQAWIDYDGISQEVSVRISPVLGKKPYKPLLRTSLDLSKVFNKYMSVGFSAATGDFAAKHIIHSWQFEESTTLQHWQSANNAVYEKASVLPAGSELSRKSPFYHVGNLPVFRNPHKRREYDMSRRTAASDMVFAAAEEEERKPMMGMRKNCAEYLPDFAKIDISTFKEHFVVNSLWALLGFASALLVIHLFFIIYHILVGCYDICFDHSDEALDVEYRKVVDQPENEADEARYVLVLSESQHHQQRGQSENRALDRV